MKKIVGILVSTITALGLAACDTGSAGDDVQGDDAVDDEITCDAALSITGTFVESVPIPVGRTGCWPVGTWTFNSTVVSNDCSPAPTPAQQQFTVERDLAAEQPDYTFIYTYVTDPSDTTHRLSVSGDGGGLCEGQLELFSDDGLSVWNLHPTLQLGGVLDGQGTFEVHTRDQRPSGGN
jgi:hypothetical protein